jgi:hypothetical protein
MYLFIYHDGTCRQVTDNLTTADLLAIKTDTLRVYIFVDGQFYRIVIDENKICKVPIPEANIIKVDSNRLHHI